MEKILAQLVWKRKWNAFILQEKEGPKKGVQEEIKKQLASLKDQLEKEKQQAVEWRFKYLESVKYSMHSKQTSPSLPASTSTSSTSSPFVADTVMFNTTNNSSESKRKRDSDLSSISSGEEESPKQSSNDSLVLSSKKSRSPSTVSYDTQSFEQRLQKMIAEIPLHPTSDYHLYVTSLLNDFLDVYYTYVHPFHPLLPEDYPNEVSSLCKILTNTNVSSRVPGISRQIDNSSNERNDNDYEEDDDDEVAYTSRNKASRQAQLFVLLALLANSCLKIGDKKHAEDFINRARALAGVVFDRVDYCIGCGFGLITYYYICIGEFDKVSSYSSIIDNICIRLGATNTHLYAINFYFKIFFAYGQFENMCEILDKLLDTSLRDKQSVLIDKITSTCFRSHVEMYNMIKSSSDVEIFPKLTKLYNEVSEVEKVYNTNIFDKHTGRLLLVQLYCAFAHLFFRLQQYDSAAKWAFKVLDFIKNDPNYKYVCIMVLNTVIPVSMDILFELKYYQEYLYLLNETKYLAQTFELFKPEYVRLSERALLINQPTSTQAGYSPPQSHPSPPQQQTSPPQKSICNQGSCLQIEEIVSNKPAGLNKMFDEISKLDPETSMTLLRFISESQNGGASANPGSDRNVKEMITQSLKQSINTANNNNNNSNNNNNNNNNFVTPLTPTQELLSAFENGKEFSPTSSAWEF